MIDFCVEQENSAERPALIGEILGAANVNIEGLCMIQCGENLVIHFVVEDADTAKRVLEAAGIKVKAMSEVFVLDKDERKVTGKPGSFGRICRTLAKHGPKIHFGYPAENNRFVIGVDDLAKAQTLLGS